MPKFEINYTEHTKYTTVIDADTIEDAIDAISYGNNESQRYWIETTFDDFYHTDVSNG